MVLKVKGKTPFQNLRTVRPMKIVTNNRRRLLIDFNQLTEKEQKEFDYCNEQGSFFRYRGNVYYIGNFTIIQRGSKDLTGWDGSSSDTAFSATLVKICKDDNDYIIAGRCYC